MALGKKIIVWDAEEFIRGASSSDDISDGGFSPETTNVNLINTPGVMYQPAKAVDTSNNLTGQMIASCEDPTGTYSRLFVSQDSDQDGRFFSLSTANALAVQGSEDTTANYIQGRTDMIAYANEAYITTASTIVRWSSIGGANTFNTAFFAFSDAFAPHPAIVYQNSAYYGDGDILLRQTSAGGTPATVLTLSAGSVIVALGIDPGSGKMLISVIGQYNISDTINSNATVQYYDGNSPQVAKTVQVEQMITAFPTSEGGLYAAYGNNIGYWNGAGVSFLRNFSDIGYDNNELFYKQHFTNIGSTLYFCVENRIWAHGSVRQSGDHIFYPAFDNIPGGVAKTLTHITNIGSGNIGLSYETSKFFIWNTTAISTAEEMTILSNEYDFKEFTDGVWIRRMRIFLKNTVSTGVSPFSMKFYNQDGVVTSLGSSGVFNPTNTTGGASAMLDFQIGGGTGTRQYQLQFWLSFSASPTSTNPGIRRIEIFGDPANT